jgi:hypothetical protein
MNSNAINAVVGFILPAAVIGLGRVSAAGQTVALWYAGLTIAILILAYVRQGLSWRWGNSESEPKGSASPAPVTTTVSRGAADAEPLNDVSSTRPPLAERPPPTPAVAMAAAAGRSAVPDGHSLRPRVYRGIGRRA